MSHYRAYLLAAVACTGGFLFGYDTGVAGGVIALHSFKQDFGLLGDAKASANLGANVVSVLQAGCFVGALAAAPLTARFGRKWSIFGWCMVFQLGAVLQVIAKTIGYIYAGRFIAGLCIGAVTTLAPTYVAECAPKSQRGRLGVMWQTFIVTGVAVSYWTVYGVSLHVSDTSAKQWKIPFGVQCIPGGLCAIGILLCRESPRWLCRKGRDEEALEALAWIRSRPITDTETLEEFAEIKTSIEEENRLKTSASWKEVTKKGNWNRFAIAIWIMTAQQWGGQNAVNYYAPTVFQSVGLRGTTTPILASGVYGAIKVVATIAFILIGIEQLGRRRALWYGGVGMGTCMIIIGSLGLTHPPDPKSDSTSSASMAMIAFFYLFGIVYSFSWGPTPWVYGSEIMPNNLREYGIAVLASSQWLMNFALSRTTPVAVLNIGYRLWITFGVINMLNAAVAFCLPETQGRTLEEMDIIFGLITAEERKADISRMEGHLGIGAIASPTSADYEHKRASSENAELSKSHA